MPSPRAGSSARRSSRLHSGWGTPPYLVPNLRTVTGEVRLMPGLRIVRSPGHTPGSQALVVDTAHGSFAIAGDAISTYDNVDRDLPPGYHVDVDASMDSLDALRSAADYLLPSHDYAVFTDGPVTEIGPAHGADRGPSRLMLALRKRHGRCDRR